MQEIELIVLGDVQGVGYRQYVAKIGRRLKLAGFVKNLKDGTVQIRCKGNKEAIEGFQKQINVKNPPEAPLVDVKDIKEKPLKQGTIKQKFFEEKYGELKAEMSQGNTTGMNYLNLFRTQTQAGFEHMDEKYDAISKAMFAVVSSIEDRNKTFENTMEKFESRIEKTEKNIESLLKILAEKKS